jgi:hypothetical protein
MHFFSVLAVAVAEDFVLRGAPGGNFRDFLLSLTVGESGCERFFIDWKDDFMVRLFLEEGKEKRGGD